MQNASRLGRLFGLLVEAVSLGMKTRRYECGGNQVTRRLTARFQVRADAPIHLGVAQRLQTQTKQALLALG